MIRVVMIVAVMLSACATGGDEDGIGTEGSEIRKGCPQGEGVSYVSRNKHVCSTVLFTCVPGSVSFNNQCGCGCEPDPTPPPSCPEASDPSATYIANDPGSCALIRFACAEGKAPFFSDCGCGCVDSAPADCQAGGCSGELCYDPAFGPGISTCLYLDEYACYADATCERQGNGSCGWTQTTELQTCLAQN